jgi:chemotaxis signal transduction protein
MEHEISSLDSLVDLTHQYIVARVGSRRLAFPQAWVAGLLLVERSQVLTLPFYHSAILGVVHHQGNLVPLVQLQYLVEGVSGQLREVFNVVQLTHPADLAGVGLVIDQILGRFSEARIAADSTIEPLQPEILDKSLCQPQRWGPLGA